MVSLRLLTSSDVPSCRNMEKDVTLQHQINNRSNIMNKAELVKSTDGYSVATVGNLDSFEGKAFVKDILGTTSVELSFGTLAPGTSVPFFHHHKQNEEVYVVLSGEGVFILDGKEEPVASGSIVRVAPEVSRNTKCTGNVPLVYICIQGKAGSLEQYTMTDGVVEE